MNKNYKKKQPYNNRMVQTVQMSADTEKSSNRSFAFMAGDDVYDRMGNDEHNITFILDSGASDHLINRQDLAQHFETLQQPIAISVAKYGT